MLTAQQLKEDGQQLKQEDLMQILNYDASAGLFTWLTPLSNRVKVGDSAGSFSNRGYLQISLNGRKYLAHRLAWLYTTGSFPKHYIDHIDGCKNNNRISNLRECSKSENTMNTGVRSSNTSGYKGVCFYKRDGTWAAQIKVNGKKTHLGYFKTPESASIAYENSAKNLFGEFYKEAIL